jgi:FkbM family methyltransferase
MALGLWEPYVRKTLTLRRGDALVDVGAHIGYHTLYASRRVGTSGSVIAIEPDERNLALLRKNTGAAKASNVQILEAAAGLGNTLYLLPCENPLYTKTVGRIEAGDLGEVNSIPLDRLMASLSFGRHSNIFLKIDVEGSELDVIRGGLSFIKTYHPTIIVESWNHTLLQQTLAEAGYDCIRLFAFYYRCVPAEETPSSN